MDQFRNAPVMLWNVGSAILPSAAADEAASTLEGMRISPEIFSVISAMATERG